jgi:hypothetical protein
MNFNGMHPPPKIRQNATKIRAALKCCRASKPERVLIKDLCKILNTGLDIFLVSDA